MIIDMVRDADIDPDVWASLSRIAVWSQNGNAQHLRFGLDHDICGVYATVYGTGLSGGVDAKATPF